MVPAQGHVEGYCGEEHKDHQRDHFLNHFELHQGERASVPLKPYAVCGHLETVFEESYSPREENDENQRCGVGEETCLLEFEVTIPSKRHKYIGREEKENGV